MMEPTLADLLQQQQQTGWSGDQMIGGAAIAPGGPLGAGQAALGMQAMKNIQGALPQQQQLVMPNASFAPKSPQIKLDRGEPMAAGIDPRIQMGLAQLLFGGK